MAVTVPENQEENDDFIPMMPDDFGKEFKDSPLYTPIDDMSEEDLDAADKERTS